MATKLYPVDTASSISGASNFKASLTAGSGRQTSSNSSVAGATAGVQVGGTYVWYSEPLGAITISGTVTFNTYGAESNMSANAGAHVKVERCNSAGTVQSTIVNSERGVEYAVSGVTGSVNNWTATPTSTSLTGGDRLKFTFYHNDAGGTMGSGYNLLFTYNSATTATDGDTWVQFTEDLVEQSAPTIALNTTDATDFGTDTTPTLEFTGTDAQSDDVRYNTQIDTSTGFGLATYYFNASDTASTDANAVWTDDANAFDGSTGTFASSSTNGTTASNFLLGEGTDAPTSGTAITTVRARAYGKGVIGVPDYKATIYTDGLTENLGEASSSGSSAAWGNYITLTQPSGGWTWQKVNDLEVKMYKTAGGNSPANAYRVEVEVTYALTLDKTSNTDAGFLNTVNGADTDPFTSGQKVSYTVQDALTTSGTYYWRARASDPSGLNTYSAWPTARSFTVTATPADDHTIVTQDIANAVTIDNATITQNHVIVPQDIAIATRVDADTISQIHAVTAQDIAIGTSTDNATTAIVHSIVSADIALSLTEDTTTISQNHVVTAQDVTITTREDNTTISQNHVIPTADVAISLSEDATTISQIHSVTGQDIAIALTEDNTSITQNHVVATQDVAVSLTEDNATINQNHIVLPTDVALSLTEDNTTVAESSLTIAPNDVAISVTEDNATISQVHALTPADLLISTKTDNTTISQNHVVLPQDVAVALTLDNATISQNQIIAVQDILVSTTTDTTTITQVHVLVVQDILNSLTTDNTTVNEGVALQPNDISISLALDNTLVTQNYIISPADILHSTTVDATTINQNHAITVQDVLLSLTEDNTTLAQAHTLIPADIGILLTIDNAYAFDGTPQAAKKYYIDTSGRIYWVINEAIGLVEKI